MRTIQRTKLSPVTRVDDPYFIQEVFSRTRIFHRAAWNPAFSRKLILLVFFRDLRSIESIVRESRISHTLWHLPLSPENLCQVTQRSPWLRNDQLPISLECAGMSGRSATLETRRRGTERYSGWIRKAYLIMGGSTYESGSVLGFASYRDFCRSPAYWERCKWLAF